MLHGPSRLNYCVTNMGLGMRFVLKSIVGLVFLVTALGIDAGQAQDRVALVIGNGAYVNATRLLTPQ
jgi:hypothetical protein